MGFLINEKNKNGAGLWMGEILSLDSALWFLFSSISINLDLKIWAELPIVLQIANFFALDS